MNFTDDILTDSTVFNCSDLLSLNISLNSNDTLMQQNLENEFAGIQCLVSPYFYIFNNPFSPLNQIIIVNVPEDMNTAFMDGVFNFFVRPDKIGSFECYGKQNFNYTITNSPIVFTNATAFVPAAVTIPLISGCQSYDLSNNYKCF